MMSIPEEGQSSWYGTENVAWKHHFFGQGVGLMLMMLMVVTDATAISWNSNS
jgi:hypothetical protein